MNHEELKQLVERIENISLDLENELGQLRRLYIIREASRNTGRRSTEDYKGTASTQSKPTKPTKDPNDNNSRGPRTTQSKRPTVGDTVEVTRGRNQGAIGIVIRETPAQFKIRSDQVIETFHKWKSNMKLIKRRA